MSRKRRRYAPKKEIVVRQDQQRSAADGYVNSLAYLGEASELTKANDYERHPISNNYELLTVMYRENWLAARIIDTPCEDMTRSWYTVASEIDQEKLDDLAKLESKHSVQQEITNAIRWARLYGGAAAVMVIKGQEDMLDQPLDFDMIQPGCFRGLIVVDRTRGIFPSIDLEEDMDDPEFGYPKWYDVMLDEESGSILRVHHSRLLLFKGRMLPIDEEIREDYWGASELEHVYEELQKRNATSANIAQLVFQANVAALKMSDFGEIMGMGTPAQREQLYRTIMEMNRLRTSFGVTLMSQEDSYEQHPYSFAGVAEVYETFMMDMAGAAEIPATKLFGRAPQGMNSTGESDMKNYYEVIAQLQERQLKPALEKLLPVMCMSLWGVIPDDLEIVFEPLGTTTPSERATIMGQLASPIVQAYSAGLVTQRMALMELRETGKPINAWTNISDDDIEKASDEFDNGEMGGMPGMEGAGMEGGMPGMPGMEAQPEGEMPIDESQPEGEMMPEGTQPAVEMMAENQPQVEMPTENQPEVEEDSSERFQEAINRVRKLKKVDPDRLAAIIERMEGIKERIGEDGGPGSGPPPGYKKKSALHHVGEEPVSIGRRAGPVTPKASVAPKAAPSVAPKVAPKAAPSVAPKAPKEKKQRGLIGMLNRPPKPVSEAEAKKREERKQTREKRAKNIGSFVKGFTGGMGGGLAAVAHGMTKQGVHAGPIAGSSGGTEEKSAEPTKTAPANPTSSGPAVNANKVETPDFTKEINKHSTVQPGQQAGEIPSFVNGINKHSTGHVTPAPEIWGNGKERSGRLRRDSDQQDGGPGSGPRPGYHKKSAGLLERAKFMMNPGAHLQEQSSKMPERTAASVNRANKEREDWSNLTMHQKIAGNAAENRHIRQMRKQVMKAAAKGDIEGAKKIVNANKQYFKNDIPSAMKVQSETLKRQKAASKGLF